MCFLSYKEVGRWLFMCTSILLIWSSDYLFLSLSLYLSVPPFFCFSFLL